MDVEKVTDELYGLKPAEFVPARDRYVAQARTAKDTAAAKAIAALRRPALAAWAANLLARRQPGQAEELLTLGVSLREAHRTLDAERLRTASRRQHQLVTALARLAADLAREAGQPVSETVTHDIERTLHGVLADPDVAARWSKGRLVTPPSAAVGFPAAAPEAVAARTGEAERPRPPGESGERGEPGERGKPGESGGGKAAKAGREVSPTPGRAGSRESGGAVAGEFDREASRRARERARARTAAEEAAEEAAAEAGRRERELHEAQDARHASAERAEEAADRVRHLEQELRAARRTVREAAEADAEAGAALTAAERALRTAREAATRAARAVERLER
ncbi:collagen-like protein [Streptomyces sp. NPDC059534]|uniref:collagen-like triple helix repeat-containing protein n=1 Tax=Streptomyces sp. NPDC059534 TaxID=3346859 RepID=UPI0036A12F1A